MASRLDLALTYSDGMSASAGPGRPNARDISNMVAVQSVSMPDGRGLSDCVWQWGQFLDHELDLSPEEESESFLEKEIVRLIDVAVNERLIELGIEDIKIIAKEIMPDLDRMIASRVKTHFYEIGSFLVNKFGDMEEGE